MLERSLFAVVTAVGLSLAIGGASVQAAGRGSGPAAGTPPTWSGSSPPGFSSPGNRTGWDGNTQPPGWSNTQGQQKGWGTGTVPPGLQKR